MPKVTVASEGIGILGKLGNLEGIIGNIIIVPNAENVENSLSGLHFIPNKETNVESIVGYMIIITITFFSFA